MWALGTRAAPGLSSLRASWAGELRALGLPSLQAQQHVPEMNLHSS